MIMDPASSPDVLFGEMDDGPGMVPGPSVAATPPGMLQAGGEDPGEDNDNDDACSEASAASGDEGPTTGLPRGPQGLALPETFGIEGGTPPEQSPTTTHYSTSLPGSLADSYDATLLEAGPDNLQTAEQAMGNLTLLRSHGSGTFPSIPAPQPSAASPTAAPSSNQPSIATGSGEHDEAWRRQSKHFFILTSSGKPVYTYHGETDSLAGLMALITALVSVVQAHGDRIHHLLTGGITVVFVLRGPLILVATSKLGEPVEVLQRQLELLYRQVLLVVTTGLERILLRNPAYDVRVLLDGVGPILTTLASRLCCDASYLLPGVQPLILAPQDQAGLSQALAEAVKSSGALYGVLLVGGGRVVAVDQDSSVKGLPPLDAADIMVLDNFVSCNASIRQQQGEAFCPLCLPAYNPAAFLHTYLHFITPSERDVTPSDTSDVTPVTPVEETGIYLALLAPSSDHFHAMSRAREQLEAQLQQAGTLQRLRRAIKPNGPAWLQIERLPVTAGGGKLGCTALWHFMARFAHRRQVVAAQLSAPFSDLCSRQRLSVSYGQLHTLVMDYPPGGRPNKLVWLCTEQQVMLAVLDAEVELYLVLDPLCDKVTALRCAEQLRRHLATRTVREELLLP